MTSDILPTSFFSIQSVFQHRVALSKLLLFHYPLVYLLEGRPPLFLQLDVSLEGDSDDLARHQVLWEQVVIHLHAVELIVDQGYH